MTLAQYNLYAKLPLSMKVLIVEDFAPIREAVVQGLSEAGFAVDHTADGEEGLWYAESADYDVIVLDLMLPGIDGITILQKLRKQQCKASIIILTAKDTVQDRVFGLDQGADDYLVKPFAFTELLSRIRSLMRRRYQVDSPVLQIKDLEVNTISRIVKRNGKTLRLSAKEYSLLEYLAFRSGQIVSRDEIWEHVYDFNYTAESNVIDSFIKLIRKKVEDPNLVPLIHTFRGQGYMLGERI